MSLDEFRLWQQFDAEWPLQDLRSDIHSAQVTRAVINMAGKARKEDVSLQDVLLFQPKPPAPPPKHSPDDLFKGKV